MNVVDRRETARCRSMLSRRIPLYAFAILLSAGPLVATAAEQAVAGPEPAAAVDDDASENDDTISLAAYNVKADRIEDFGIRVKHSIYSGKPNVVTFWFSTFGPVISAVVPNTAAARTGLQPGERILKSDGRSTLGGLFSDGKWRKAQAKKWTEVASGKKNVTWTLEVETPVTKAVRTVKLVVPTPPPHWGSSVWRMPEGRSPNTVLESGPLAERSRAVLDNGIWTLLDPILLDLSDRNDSSSPEPTGYEWHFGSRREGLHKITATQFRGRTEVALETISRATGHWSYLTSPSGALVRARHWPFKRGSGEVPLEQARTGFENELDFWTTKVEKVSARWPFQVKPGYDANAIFASLAAKNGASTVEIVRPFAEEFLKLRAVTGAEQAMFTEAYGKLGAEQDQWAYTETSRNLEDKRVTVKRVDPSKPEAERCVLLSINGKSPTPADVQQWRDNSGDTPKALGDLPPLTSIVDLKDLRIFKDETAAVVFELPIRNGSADFPAEKFQALFRVSKTYRSFEDITIKMRDSIRVAGVVKLTAGLQARFQTLDPARPPQPVSLKGGGAARILLVKISRDFETTRADFKRVQPYVEPDPSEPAATPISTPAPGLL